jgi:multisubunit Na+/H+ antiporter MnhB subunit
VATLTLLEWAFDVLLVCGLLWLAWRALSSTDLFMGIVLFIAFGLLMALAWVRLDAPDIALAEAAIGAGLTGALLLAAFARLRPPNTEADKSEQQVRAPSPWRGRWAGLLCAGGFIGLSYVILTLPPHAAGLSEQVTAHLDSSGVSNPVTAVLLNFRGYDTLLEVMVLLLALLGVWSFGNPAPHDEPVASPVLNILTRALLPVLGLVAAYLLWVGAHAPGGAFQAGSVLGAAGVLLILAGWRLRPGLAGLPLRVLLALGPAVFLIVAGVSLLSGRHLLEYRDDQAGMVILILETAATISIGITLALLFLGARPDEAQDADEDNP